jgi:hypothetical protein
MGDPTIDISVRVRKTNPPSSMHEIEIHLEGKGDQWTFSIKLKNVWFINNAWTSNINDGCITLFL